jgi:SAM-dependent methyltransferase
MSAAPIDGLSLLTDATCGDLRAHFAAVGFTPDLITQAELFAPGLLLGPRLPLLRWWLEQRSEPGAALARLFVYHDALPSADARSALGAELTDALIAAGVVAPASTDNDGLLTARFIITPLNGGLWLLSDALTAGADAAMGPGGGTQVLGRLVPQGFRGTVLDVGCGAGSLALIAAHRGARRAIGVDINPRAVEIARFNARLNNLAADFEVGDATQPVAGQRFDLVLSQPPFVVHPADQANVTYLFGGAGGDELPLRFASEIARMLVPGGRALMLMQVPEREGDPVAGRIRAALNGAPVDVLIIGSKAPLPAVQASVFASYDDPTLGQRYDQTVRSYLKHFQSLGVNQFSGALVVLGCPPSETPREGRYTVGIRLSEPQYDAEALDQFLRGLELIGLPPAVFERARLRLSPYARLASTPSETGDPSDEKATIQIESPGIGTTWSVGPDELRFLDAIENAPSVAAVIASLSAASLATAPGVQISGIRDRVLACARDALVRGALISMIAA